MFEAELQTASSLKKIIDSIKDLVNEADFECVNDAMFLESMDAAHFALISLKLSRAFFRRYHCDQRTLIGLKMDDVSKALKCAGEHDMCYIGEFDGDNVLFRFRDLIENKNQNITLKRMIVDEERLTIPEEEYSAVIEMCSKEFAKLMGDLSQFTDTVKITVKTESVTFFGANDHRGSIEVQYDGEINTYTNTALLIFQVHENVTSNFQLKYMQMFAKAFAISDRVRLSISAEHPLMVEYKIGEDAGYLRFYLAPRIDDPDDDDIF